MQCAIFLSFLVLTFTLSVDATVYIVDGTHGSNDNSGLTTSDAFQTIKHCVRALHDPGDVCELRAGRYHEVVEINGLKAPEDNPFIVRGFRDEKAIWDGTVAITPEKWDFNADTGICSAAINNDITALFWNEDLLTAARWPNGFWHDKSSFSRKTWGKSDKSSQKGAMVDNGEKGLAESKINATGAMAILNIGSFCTFCGPVTHHEPGNNTFLYDDIWHSSHWIPERNQYFLEAKLEFLDAPTEWFYDMDSKMLYLIPPEGNECPDNSTLRGRTHDYGLTIKNTTGLTIANLTFFASTFHGISYQHESKIEFITIDSIQMFFGASSRRMLKDWHKPKWTYLSSRVDKLDSDGNYQWGYGKIQILNSTFIGSEGQALQYAGKALIKNNLFQWTDWTGHLMDEPIGGSATINGASHGEEFTQNTLLDNSCSAGIRPGDHATISYNHVGRQTTGELMHDGAGIHLGNSPQEGSKIHHNWVRNSPRYGIRFDGGGSRLGSNGTIDFNVVWSCNGITVKGDNHTIRNNLGLGRSLGPDPPEKVRGGGIGVIYRLGTDPVIENKNSVVLNNGGVFVDGGHNVFNDTRWPLPEQSYNNFNDKIAQLNLYDAYNWDFRPLENSNFTNGDEIIGAYPSGYQTFYWIPGRKEYITSTPIPWDGATVGADRDVLMFLQAYRAYNYNWFLGTNEANVKKAEIGDAEYQGQIDAAANILVLPKLENNQQYFWRVDAQWGGYIYKGNVWSFTTNSALNKKQM